MQTRPLPDLAAAVAGTTIQAPLAWGACSMLRAFRAPRLHSGSARSAGGSARGAGGGGALPTWRCGCGGNSAGKSRAAAGSSPMFVEVLVKVHH